MKIVLGLFCFILYIHASLAFSGNKTSSIQCHEECDPPDRCRDSSPATCFDCKNRRLATTGECINKCPKGFYAFQENIGNLVFRLCGPYSSDCDVCTGPRRFECQRCANGHYMDTMNFFGGKWMRLCRPCHESCATCFGVGAVTNRFFCLSCSEGYFRSSRYSQMRRAHVLTCEKCHDTCKACSGRSQYECLTCGSGRFLRSSRTETRYYSRVKIVSRCVRCEERNEEDDGNGDYRAKCIEKRLRQSK